MIFIINLKDKEMMTAFEKSCVIAKAADDKKAARLNCIHHLLGIIPYKDVTPSLIKLPERHLDSNYIRPPKSEQNFVPEVY